MTWDNYHSFEVIEAYIEFLGKTFSHLVHVEEIGSSFEGRGMKVIKICKTRPCGKKPAMWIDGGIHAREWIAPATVTFIIRKLMEVIELIASNRHNTELIDKVDWYFLPVLNPDGK